MNTDIFGKEERKQMLDRIERMEKTTDTLIKAVADINDKLAALTLMTVPEKISGESVAEIQAKRDAEFKERMDKIREDGDAKFEEEMGVLKEIRSHMAETNSLLEAILRKMDEPKPIGPPQVPIQPPITWTSNKGTSVRYANTMPKGTTGGPPSDVSCDANPYIPENPYKDDVSNCDVSQLDPKPLIKKEEDLNEQ